MIMDKTKRLVGMGLFSLLLMNISSVTFGDPPGLLGNLDQSVLNLGGYLGYDLNNQNPNPVSSELLNAPSGNQATGSAAPALSQDQQNAVMVYLGALLTTTIVSPNVNTVLNTLSNAIFKNGVFNSSGGQQQGADAGASQPTIKATKLIDLQPFEPDPVDQSTKNFLATPDMSFCTPLINNGCKGAGSVDPILQSICCPKDGGMSLAQNFIASNVIGGTPDSTIDIPNGILNQLNGSTFINPLLYSTTSENDNPSSGTQASTGLQASNQAEMAANFIRYVSGAVAPIPKTTSDVYGTYITDIKNAIPGAPQDALNKGLKAQTMITNYLANLRVAAAQNSVGVNNLYEMLSKRVAQQPQGGASNKPTSQALTEFTMATRRLYDPNGQKTQWIDQINKASSATVQKEIAILLSEINYQLYLTRQQQEKLLLTNTVMLFQLGHLVAPPPLQRPQN